MTDSAYLLIRASEAVRQNGYLEALEELWALPEVDYVEPVSNLYDCVVRVEASATRLVLLIHEVMSKSWVEEVHLLRVDQPVERAVDWEQSRTAKLRQQRACVWAHRRGLQGPSPSPQHPYAGHAAAIRTELEEARSLSRQLEIIKSHYDKSRTSATPVPDR